MHKKLLVPSLLLAGLHAQAQNLLQNGGAETATATHWTVDAAPSSPACYGTVNWRADIAQLSSSERSGGSLFFPGCSSPVGGTYELYQNVSVAGDAGSIDAGYGVYTFEGWHSSWNQTNPDQVGFVFEYRNAANAVLGSYNSGLISAATNNSNTQAPWTRYIYTMTLPAGTRSIRLRLLAKHNTGSAIDSYFDDLSIVAGYWPLALGLSDFDGREVAGGVKLTWKDNRAANAGYNTYWSTDGTDWQRLGFVAAAQESAPAYSFVHTAPAAGKNFYRIAAVGLDGSLSYSATLTVAVNEKNAPAIASVWPVPATDGGATLSGLHASLAGTTAILLDARGSVVRRIALDGQPSAPLPLAGCAPGLYTLRLADGQVLRVVKQ